VRVDLKKIVLHFILCFGLDSMMLERYRYAVVF